ncbi:MAG: metal ABC transporter ATP-binding protein [Firmicutes bacterium]|nr:metal ABC transporter ATP-binding protein [Bacillota bacterium]MDD7601745.1 metal ABC transporter ATP-binding protein [Bacillota bacterium]MDY5855452.1 metal ABC transporter ATP-binding protein [Anaerovoracaceae bacterium]
MAQLTCENLTLGFEGQPVTKNLNFTVNQGDYLCIVGENGTGKSTLMKTILHLRNPVMSGSITTGDGLKPTEIGYLPQQTDVQRDFPASVREVVLSGCLSRCGLRPFYSRQDRLRAAKNLERLGISHLAGTSYRYLSGGQQQRVLLARALCATEKMLLLDEPVAGLDPAAAAEMYEIIGRLNKEEGITIIMVSHDITQALGQATHILHLAKEPLFFGTRDEYLRSSIGQAFATIMIAGMEGGETDD